MRQHGRDGDMIWDVCCGAETRDVTVLQTVCVNATVYENCDATHVSCYDVWASCCKGVLLKIL